VGVDWSQMLVSGGGTYEGLTMDRVLATRAKGKEPGPDPRNYGMFPRVVGVYVRKLGLLWLEDAVWKMTSLNAAKLGIEDRGLLRPGNWADVSVFDPERVLDRATYEAPFQYPESIAYLVANGQVVLEEGKPTGARPGRALRRSPCEPLAARHLVHSG
jgi:N-acyl-D-amino-acid deacylase